MNAEQIKGNWKQLTGQVKQKWGKLTDDEITRAEGNAEILAGRLQERYGQKKEEALASVNEFFEKLNAK